MKGSRPRRVDLGFELGGQRSAADQRGGDLAAWPMQQRDGVDQSVDAFDRTQFAEKDQIGGVGRERDRLELRRADAIVHDPHQAGRLADLGVEDVGAVGAFKQIEIAARHQQAFEPEIDLAGQVAVVEQQAAAMRRIGPHRRLAGKGKPGEGAAFGAVAVHDVGLGRANAARDMVAGGKIGRTERPLNGGQRQAERQRRRQAGEHRLGGVAAGQAVGNDADAMAARDLALHQIGDVAKQPADRRAQNVKNIEGLHEGARLCGRILIVPSSRRFGLKAVGQSFEFVQPGRRRGTHPFFGAVFGVKPPMNCRCRPSEMRTRQPLPIGKVTISKSVAVGFTFMNKDVCNLAKKIYTAECGKQNSLLISVKRH